MQPEEFKVGMRVWSRTLECYCYFTEQCQALMDKCPRDPTSVFLAVEEETGEVMELTAYLMDYECHDILS